ncbi:MAG: hypothetical protein KAT70_01600, partial [Thermoplasmata archaeon]|nr:hypothetical protein [Thermoplasmata archaeon]
MISHIRNAKIADTRVKSLAYAFLMAVDEDSGAGWKYSDHEREFAQYLREFASRLLECKDGEYGEALEAVAQASGSGENIA